MGAKCQSDLNTIHFHYLNNTLYHKELQVIEKIQYDIPVF